MEPLTLVIANKNYSSWSMRPWVMLTQAGIPFTEIKLDIYTDEWRRRVAELSPSRLLPVLWRGDRCVWDSLAIMEALHEWFPEAGIWPEDPHARANARCVASEMHAGFRELRNAMPMNIRRDSRGRGLTDAVRADIARIERLWSTARRAYGSDGPYLFGHFCAADAMFAPVVMRFRSYGVELDPVSCAYRDAMVASESVSRWMRDALQETQVVAEAELPLIASQTA